MQSETESRNLPESCGFDPSPSGGGGFSGRRKYTPAGSGLGFLPRTPAEPPATRRRLTSCKTIKILSLRRHSARIEAKSQNLIGMAENPGRLLKLVLFAALFGVGMVQAQDQQQDDQSAAQAQEQEQTEQGQAEAEEESTGETEENEGFERFIPTEQVSRDLGVSFPADI